MNKSKILIIDDDHQISDGARLRLRAAGYETIAAYDGAEGVSAAQEERPDAILLDIRMPVMDGLTALKHLQNDPKTTDIPVVMLSASIVDQDAALDGGATYFLRKPFSGIALVEAINAATH